MVLQPVRAHVESVLTATKLWPLCYVGCLAVTRKIVQYR